MRITNLVQYLEETARRAPDRPAVIDNGMTINFAALRQRVLSEAANIQNRLGGRKKQIIAVNLPKSLDCVIADLACLYSGNAYMNLDSKAPAARTEAILRQTSPAMTIGAKSASQTDAIFHEIGKLGALSEKDCQALLNSLDEIIDTDLCCLINTSGSTGIPKTVALNHRGYIDYTESILQAGLIGMEAVAGSMAPTVFDHFSFELCLMMATGCCLALIPDGLPAFPVKLLEFINEKKVSFIFWVPTIMVNIANMDLLSKIDLPYLETIWFAGEVFPTPKFNYWRRHLPNAKFVNLYGPTEITVDCLYHVLDNTLENDETIPVGKPLPNTAILVLDEHNHEISQNSPALQGELCVRGSSLAMGYYNNPEQTSESFTQNPLNNKYPEIIYHTGDIVSYNDKGELLFHGRLDSMIKHYGYRIELGEIEKASFNIEGILNSCAIYDRNDKKIVLYYEAGAPLDGHRLRCGLMKFLPRYMLPSLFLHLTEMPRNANGKIDRRSLENKYQAEYRKDNKGQGEQNS